MDEARAPRQAAERQAPAHGDLRSGAGPCRGVRWIPTVGGPERHLGPVPERHPDLDPARAGGIATDPPVRPQRDLRFRARSHDRLWWLWLGTVERRLGADLFRQPRVDSIVTGRHTPGRALRAERDLRLGAGPHGGLWRIRRGFPR